MQRELLTPILKPTILETFPFDNRSTIYLHKEEEQQWEGELKEQLCDLLSIWSYFWSHSVSYKNAPTKFTPEQCAYNISEMDFETLSFAVPSVLCSANAYYFQIKCMVIKHWSNIW